MVNQLIYLHQQLFYLLWLPSIHHSQPHSQQIHSIDVWLPIEPISSGKHIAKTKKVEKHSFLTNLRILFSQCYNLIHLIDHQWLKCLLIHGCKVKNLLQKRYSINSNKEMQLCKQVSKRKDKLKKMKRQKE